MFINSPYDFKPGTMLSAIQRVGVTSGLKLCLDASDINSYASGQSWLDTSGNGYDFFRGATSGAESSDPTYNGTPGGQSSSEYWSFDGGDYFTYDAANETWMENLHKNNAKFAWACWLYLPLGGTAYLFGTNDSTTATIGASVLVRSDETVRVGISNGSGGPGQEDLALQITTTSLVPTNSWAFVSGVIDESAGTGTIQIGDTQEDFVTTYTSPSAGAASFQMRATRSGSPTLWLSTSKLSSLTMWESAMPTKANMLDLHNLTKGKFGL